ncbi:MAG: hypothetical protein AAFY46_08375, partial [Planctomycetota bacterium]
GRIFEQYEAMVDEFNLHVIDATLPIAEQQKRLRELVSPHLKEAAKMPIPVYSDVLNEYGLAGRYLGGP